MPRTIGAPALALAAGLTVLAAGFAVGGSGGVETDTRAPSPAATATGASGRADDVPSPAQADGEDDLLAAPAGLVVEATRPTGVRPLVLSAAIETER